MRDCTIQFFSSSSRFWPCYLHNVASFIVKPTGAYPRIVEQRVTHYRTTITIYSVIPTRIRGPWRTTNLKTQFAPTRTFNPFKGASDVHNSSDLAISVRKEKRCGFWSHCTFMRESAGKYTRQGVYYTRSMNTRTRNYIYFIRVNTVDASQNIAVPALEAIKCTVPEVISWSTLFEVSHSRGLSGYRTSTGKGSLWKIVKVFKLSVDHTS